MWQCACNVHWFVLSNSFICTFSHNSDHLSFSISALKVQNDSLPGPSPSCLEGPQKPWNWLLSAFVSAGYPVLDRRFAICRQICNPQDGPPDMHGLIQKMHLCAQLDQKPDFALIDDGLRWQFFHLLAQNVPRFVSQLWHLLSHIGCVDSVLCLGSPQGDYEEKSMQTLQCCTCRQCIVA